MTITVRPEDVILAAADDRGGRNMVEGEIKAVLFLGDCLECQARLGDSSERFRVRPSVAVAPGQAVRLTLDPEKCLALRQ